MTPSSGFAHTLRPFNRRKHTLISRNSRTPPPKQKRGDTASPPNRVAAFPRLRVPALRRLGLRLQRGRGQRGLRTRWLGLESGPCHRGGHRRRLGLQRLPRQDLFDLLALQALPLEQRLGQAVQSFAGPEKSIARESLGGEQDEKVLTGERTEEYTSELQARGQLVCG